MGTKCTQKLADSNLKHSPLSLSLSQKFRINERGEKKTDKRTRKKAQKVCDKYERNLQKSS